LQVADCRLQRHDLVWIEPAHVADCRPDAGSVDLERCIAEWIAKARPFIVRRQIFPDPAAVARLAIGLPLPPSQGKARIGLSVSRTSVARMAAPPELLRIASAAPLAWQSTLGRICDLGVRTRIDVRIYGSLAWQALTGLPYLSPDSDLDVLLRLRPESDVVTALDTLADLAAAAPMRIDGEVVRLDGAAVQWRELHSGSQPLLIKSLHGVSLIEPSVFLATRDAAA
jgi:phosphoribosyl-dephospho-CoA transferase